MSCLKRELNAFSTTDLLSGILFFLFGCCAYPDQQQGKQALSLQGSFGKTATARFVFQRTELPQPFSEGIFIDGNHSWVVIPGGLLRTTDGGRTWQQGTPSEADRIIFGKLSDTRIKVFFITPVRGWLSVNSGTWQTEDGGLTWQRIFSAPYSSIQFADSHNGWMSTLSGPNQQMYVTQNDGETWRICASSPYNKGWLDGAYFLTPQLGWAITNKMKERATLYSVARTTDGGCHWQEVWSSIQNPDERYGDIYFLDEREGWLAGSYLGSLYRTIDGGASWQELQLPSEGLQVASVYFASSQEGWIFTAPESEGDTGIYYTATSGKTWVQLTAMEIADNAGSQSKIPAKWKTGRLAQMLYSSYRQRKK